MHTYTSLNAPAPAYRQRRLPSSSHTRAALPLSRLLTPDPRHMAAAGLFWFPGRYPRDPHLSPRERVQRRRGPSFSSRLEYVYPGNEPASRRQARQLTRGQGPGDALGFDLRPRIPLSIIPSLAVYAQLQGKKKRPRRSLGFLSMPRAISFYICRMREMMKNSEGEQKNRNKRPWTWDLCSLC